MDVVHQNDAAAFRVQPSHGALNDRFRTATRQQWIARLTAASVPAGAVRTVDEVLGDPQVVAREMITALDHPLLGSLKQLGLPVKLSGTPGALRRAPPRLGEHTDSVLTHDLGYDTDRISALRRARVI